MGAKAVVTVIVGQEAEKMAIWSVPLMRSYAEKTGSEFIILNKTKRSETLGKSNYEKYQIGEILNNYRRVLFLDADILVSPYSENVFKIVPETKVGAVSVENFFPKVKNEKDSICSVLGQVAWTQPYFNSGVMLLSENHKCLYQDTENFLYQWVNGKAEKNINALNDQTLINYCVNFFELELHDLGRSFNFTRVWGKFHHRFKNYFIHYAGLRGNRDWQMTADYAIFNSPSKHFLFSNFPWLTWIKDHFNTRYLYEKGLIGRSKR